MREVAVLQLHDNLRVKHVTTSRIHSYSLVFIRLVYHYLSREEALMRGGGTLGGCWLAVVVGAAVVADPPFAPERRRYNSII